MTSAPDDGWRRLDARMLLVHPVEMLVRLLPAVLLLVVAGDGGFGWQSLLALPVAVGLGVVRWLTTRYRVGPELVELRRGVLDRTTTTARLDRVRTVDLTAQPYHRVLRLASVEVSTAGGGSGTRLVLNALSREEARRLRAELLDRAGAVPGAPPVGLPPPEGLPVALPAPADPPVAPPAPGPEEELLRLRPAWLRFAPVTLTGLAAAVTLLAGAVQGWERLADTGAVVDAATRLSQVARWSVAGAALAAVALVSVLAYALLFWGFRLTRTRTGTLHVSRGLLTTRETTIDRARLRGVEIGEPLGLRLLGGRRLRALSTGLTSGGHGGSDWLAPPAPADVVTRLAERVADDPAGVRAPLRRHGPAATYRRRARAVAGGLAAAAVLAVGARVWGWTPAAVVAAVGALGLALVVARDRVDALGHLVTTRSLVTAEGSFTRHRVVLARAGVIGWTIRSSLFQRRAGLVTLVATTAAGRGRYRVLDVPRERALEIVAEISPDLLAELD